MDTKYVGLLLLLCFLINNGNAQDRALFFAVNDYEKNTDFGSLKNPIGDAEAIAKELRQMYGFKTKVYRNPSVEKIYKVLENWQKQTFQKDEQLFVFFSGHGTFWELASKGYFVPYGNQTGYKNYIELTTLGNIITKIQCEHILLAIDACYSGTIDRAIAFRGRPEFARPNETDQTKRNQIIAVQLRNTSRLLITSGAKERTPDGDKNSPFAGAILSGLRKTYTSGDGLFLFSDLEAQLERVSPLPHKGVLEGHEEGGFVFQSTAEGIVNRTTPKEEKEENSIVANNEINLSTSSVTDKDGNVYSFRKMKDGKFWMTKNLNVNIEGSSCYDDDPSNCEKYGRLYTWEAARNGCTQLGGAWHLPTKEEWEGLAKSYGGLGKPSFNALIEKGNNNFSAKLGGYLPPDGNYIKLGILGYYWSDTVRSSSARSFYFGGISGKLYRKLLYKTNAQSVRCVMF